MRIIRRKHVWNLLLGVLLALTLFFIWGNSLLSRENSTELSSGLLEWLGPVLEALGLENMTEHVLRKLAHFTEFAVLGCELAALFFLNRGRKGSSVFLSALCALLTAATDESLQFLSHRAPMVTDVMLDFSGSLTGILLLWLLTPRRKRA